MALLALLVATPFGCAKRGGNRSVTQVEKEALKEHILAELPADVPHKVDVNFEDRVHLVGWRAEPAVAAPDTTVRFTLYWKRTGDLDSGWKLFTHVTSDDVHDPKGNLDCVGSIRQDRGQNCAVQLYGPSDWEKDKIIVDAFEFNVPKDVTWPTYRFLVGVWKDDTRLHIVNADTNDGENRANVISLPTGVKAAEPPPHRTDVPQLGLPKLGKADAIKLDGKLDEPGWAHAASTGMFVGPGDGAVTADHPVAASAKMVWDDQNLYVGAVVADKAPSSPFKPTDKDPHIWEKSSALELMIQPGNAGDNKDYYEIQVDVNGAVFDTHWDDYNQPITGGPEDDKKVFGHMDWTSGLKQAVFVDKAAGTYVVELAIPWTAFGKARPGVNLPPHGGESWRLNLYSFKDGQRQALAWSPILGQGNFHKSARFGRVSFMAPATASASVSAAPSAKPAPSAKAAAANPAH